MMKRMKEFLPRYGLTASSILFLTSYAIGKQHWEFTDFVIMAMIVILTMANQSSRNHIAFLDKHINNIHDLVAKIFNERISGLPGPTSIIKTSKEKDLIN